MYDIAHTNSKILFKEFGVNAQYLIDHSNGIETCTIADIKAYKAKTKSISNSQVLFKDYDYEKAELVLVEMVELLSQELIEKNLETDTIKLYIGYSNDFEKHSGGSQKLSTYTNLYTKLAFEFKRLYEKITYKNMPIRRIGISFERLQEHISEQIDIFEDIEKNIKERKLEKSIIEIKYKMGKNAIIRGINLEDGATTLTRNKLIGGHNGY